MKNSIRSLWRNYYPVFLFGLFVFVSRLVNSDPGMAVAANFKSFFLEMAAILPLMFILIGLFDVWVPRERIVLHVGPGSGIVGIIWVVLLAMLQAGPLYAAFPVAALLWRKGCSATNVFIYLGAFSALKIPMLAFEISFLGLKFSLLRAVFSFPVFIGTAYLLAAYLKNRDFTVSDPG